MLWAALWGAEAKAQRTSENAILQSGDAFGQTVGGERTGLYSTDDVRGFNPIEAGNARIEGLYFDQVDRLPGRIVDASRIRVGLATQGFAFPAPTGLVDYRLTKPGAKASGSFELEVEDLFGPGLTIEGMLPLVGGTLGLSGGVGGRIFQHPEGGRHHSLNYGATLSYRPYGGAEFLAFGGAVHSREEEARPTIFPAGAYLPPRISRRLNLRQPWTDRSTNNWTYGAVATVPIRALRIEAGLFQTRKATLSAFSDSMAGVLENGTVTRRNIVADADSSDESLSGELRAVRQWTSARFAHRLVASIRGRGKTRLFGGSQRIALGTSTVLAADHRPQPGFSFGAKSRDDVSQISAGVAYSFAWEQRATVDVGLSKTSYRKRVDFADPNAFDPVTRDKPLTWNLFAAYSLTPSLRAFFGTTRGQEEAPIAPDIAVNRSEAPPAIRTSQTEAGVRYAITPKLTAVAAAFAISKPYYNLDPDLQYRQLGSIRNRGLEASLTGEVVPGLTLVAGIVFTDPRITGDLSEAGLIGKRPVGQLRRRSVVSVDWRPRGGTSALSFDLKAENVSSRIANAANSVSAPGFTTLDLGARYRFSIGTIPMVLRAQLQNALNSYGWRVSSSGGFSYSNPRTLSLALIGDL
jgi:iron complex outermembrane recepter protein